MPSDVQILPAKQGDIQFTVRGASDDTGLMLLQRIYILMLSAQGEAYRKATQGYSLLDFIEGGNVPNDNVMTSVLAIVCATVLSSLDSDDRALVASLTGYGEDGVAHITLKLTDGTTITGEL